VVKTFPFSNDACLMIKKNTWHPKFKSAKKKIFPSFLRLKHFYIFLTIADNSVPTSEKTNQLFLFKLIQNGLHGHKVTSRTKSKGK
jgi:hypothetical protein